MRILFSGGGTMGSVYPLLAIRAELIEQKICSDFVWVGTKDGVERQILEKEMMPYFSISAGKWRRYFSGKNFFDWFNVLIGFFQSLKIIVKTKPDLILTAGSFVGVPVVLAGWLLRRKIIVHQQDLKAGFANRLMAPFASKITVSFDYSLKFFPARKTVLTGNPVRRQVIGGQKQRAKEFFGLEDNLATLLVMGGSQGAAEINNLLFEAVPELILFCQIIHIAGEGNVVQWENKAEFGEKASRYHSFEYLNDELFDGYAAADLIVCRAGMSTLTEISAVAKPALVIPIPNSQQEENADYFNGKNAVLVVDQKKITAIEFVTLIKNLFDEPASRERLSANLRAVMSSDAATRYLELIKMLK